MQAARIKYNNLQVKRGDDWHDQACPYRNQRCGRFCPLFLEFPGNKEIPRGPSVSLKCTPHDFTYMLDPEIKVEDR